MNAQIDIFDPLRDPSAFLDSCTSKAYAGIGSREVEKMPDMKRLMTSIATTLDKLGWTLRSGRAKGSDRAFENGATRKEIFLPWSGFGSEVVFDPVFPPSFIRCESTAKAIGIARSFHPNWYNLTDAAKRLIARNTHQVLGTTCDDPSAFVLCWTPDGSTGKTYSRTGGTGQAIRIAHAHGIPVFNLRRDDHREAWECFAMIV